MINGSGMALHYATRKGIRSVLSLTSLQQALPARLLRGKPQQSVLAANPIAMSEHSGVPQR